MASKKKSNGRKLRAINGGKGGKPPKGESAEGEAAPPAAMKPGGGKDLVKRAVAGDESAAEALEKFLTSWERWKKALADERVVKSNCAADLSQAEAALQNAVEDPLASEPSPEAVAAKLAEIEQRWQDRNEVIAKTTEKKQQAHDVVMKWAKNLERAAEESAQLVLVH